MAQPEDGDVAASRGDALRERPIHLRWDLLGLVFLGGAVGTMMRELLSSLIPRLDGIPVAILLVNVVGAALLGYLLESLMRRGRDRGRRRTLRLVLGTGALGGFTTYSTLAMDTALLLGDGRVWTGGLYAFGTIVLGGLATFLGITIGSRRARAGAE